MALSLLEQPCYTLCCAGAYSEKCCVKSVMVHSHWPRCLQVGVSFYRKVIKWQVKPYHCSATARACNHIKQLVHLLYYWCVDEEHSLEFPDAWISSCEYWECILSNTLQRCSFMPCMKKNQRGTKKAELFYTVQYYSMSGTVYE